MTAHTLMIQGTFSSAGKSLVAAALCRIFARRGLRVAPYKSQNMSNNAAVCADGGEIGRAQALQALAAGCEPSVDMNPILLKPEADTRSQVILLGRPWRSVPAGEYYRHKAVLWREAAAALNRLRSTCDLVVIEGAGSPVELNLRQGDFANMAVASHADSPVLLVGDIDRGGIFAQMLGTLWLLEPDERRLVRGLIVNKFRGELSLFQEGVRILEERGKVPVLGVVPYIPGLNLPEEDAATLHHEPAASSASIDIAVIHLPHIANFDDFAPVSAEPGVLLRYVDTPAALGQPQALILPGTKSTIADLDWLRKTGLAESILRFVESGGHVAGICGGYQMLGTSISDPMLVESNVDQVPGLGLLPLATEFAGRKSTYQAKLRVLAGPEWMTGLEGEILSAYEIHMGVTTSTSPLFEITERNGQPTRVREGACSPDGSVWGCYLHGLFANDAFRHAWLRSLGWQGPGDHESSQLLERSLERLADEVEAALDMDRLDKIIWG